MKVALAVVLARAICAFTRPPKKTSKHIFGFAVPVVLSKLILEYLSASEHYYLANQWDKINVDELENEEIVLEVLKWRQSIFGTKQEGHLICSNAASHGHLEVLK